MVHRSPSRILAHVASSLAVVHVHVLEKPVAMSPAAAQTASVASEKPMAAMPEVEGAVPRRLTEAEVGTFLVDGYCLLPGIIPDSLNERICAEHDLESAGRVATDPRPQIVSYDELGKLCSLPMVVDKVKQLMGSYGNGESDCAMHHIHANRQLPGTGSSNWHQDYEQLPQTDRDQLMVHVFFCQYCGLRFEMAVFPIENRATKAAVSIEFRSTRPIPTTT